jgi:quinol monooxygenase YgiN
MKTTEKENHMTTQDKCCSVVPYFTIAYGKRKAFKELCEKMVEQTQSEEKCLYYGFCFNGDQAHCREGYADAAGVLTHLNNIGPLLTQALEVSNLARLEVHGPEEEIKKLQTPLAHLQPEYFILEYGFRK